MFAPVIASLRRASMAYIAHHPVTNSQLWPIVPRLGALLRQWRRRIRERDPLARLEERDLHDLGLSPRTGYAELRKPVLAAGGPVVLESTGAAEPCEGTKRANPNPRP